MIAFRRDDKNKPDVVRDYKKYNDFNLAWK